VASLSTGTSFKLLAISNPTQKNVDYKMTLDQEFACSVCKTEGNRTLINLKYSSAGATQILELTSL